MDSTSHGQPKKSRRGLAFGVVAGSLLCGIGGSVIGGVLGDNRGLLATFENNPPRNVNFFGERVTPDKAMKGFISLCGLWAFACGALLSWVAERMSGKSLGKFIPIPSRSGGPPRPYWVSLSWSDTLLGVTMWMGIQLALIAVAIGFLQLDAAQANRTVFGAVGTGVIGLLIGALGGWVAVILEVRRQAKGSQGLSGF